LGCNGVRPSRYEFRCQLCWQGGTRCDCVYATAGCAGREARGLAASSDVVDATCLGRAAVGGCSWHTQLPGDGSPPRGGLSGCNYMCVVWLQYELVNMHTPIDLVGLCGAWATPPVLSSSTLLTLAPCCLPPSNHFDNSHCVLSSSCFLPGASW
jgi:hypothetical protein